MAEANTGIAAILLAAGLSERMGAANKMQLPVDGEPLLRRSVRTLLGASIDHIVVVLGYQHETTRAMIDDLPLSIVVNQDYQSGQMTSVHCGLRALDDSYDGIVIALGDQPALDSVDIDRLVDAFVTRPGGEVVIPTYQGARGNPIVISGDSRANIVADHRNLGCRKFIENNPERVHRVEMSNPAFFTDLDTPREYETYCAAMQRNDTGPLKREAS